MNDILRGVTSRLSVGVATAIVTTVVVAGGLAYAAQTESVPNNSVTTAKIRNGAVTSAKIRNKTIQGIDIKPGAVGPGQLGINVRPRWAKVDAGVSTSLIRGRGAVSASRIAAGAYRVVFASPVNNCGWTVSRNDNASGIVSAGEIGVEQESTALTSNLYVRTFNSAGVQADMSSTDGFTLVISC